MELPAQDSGSRPDDASIDFPGKVWFFVAAAIFTGALALFGLIEGPRFYFGVVKDARGRPAPEAGAWLMASGVICLPPFALSLFNVVARRRPLISVRREGLVVRLIGGSSLDRVAFVPAMIRIVWTFISGSGFRQRLLVAPWATFSHAEVAELPMMRNLHLHGDFYEAHSSDGIPTVSTRLVTFAEYQLILRLEDIANIIVKYQENSEGRADLPTWNR